ncbi:Hypothetical predicted protein [Lecanosticta acicola]|uniref:AHC1-like C2H2 zinc-finger domain-containing protein n=1 Tax=Lecanosticta acicola TaxID=111012 RepID=A0AAI8YZW1_9PEZI|nr:Hypothetical predicted protein [Lecanosticta acicola]
MQGIFRLPWGSSDLSEKGHLDKMRASPVVEIPMLNKLKRKLPDTPHVLSPSLTSPLKRQRPEVDYPEQLPTPSSPYVDARMSCNPESAQTTLPSAPTNGGSSSSQLDAQAGGGAEVKEESDAQPFPRPSSTSSQGYFDAKPVSNESTNTHAKAVPDSISGLTPLQQVIESTLNVQILLKHNELRLIEQELAKCQISLEQLRRCEVIPYPGDDLANLSLRQGTGPAVEPPAGYTRPPHAAPYGVTDGPYTRHYAQWLLKDPQFDSVSPQAVAQAGQLVNTASRTRGHHARKPTSKSLSMSTRNSDPLQSIPNYPPAAMPVKEKLPFQTLRRSTDGQLVKLVCKDCKRSNFSSIQGFLNHCRIAHKVDYKSHDQAAVDCGQLLEEHEMASLPPEAQAVSAPKPAPTRSASLAIMPPHRSGLVHPLNTSTGIITPSTTAPHTPASAVPAISVSTPPASTNKPLKPSGQVPRLSAWFAKNNVGGDLDHAAALAKEKVDLSNDEDLRSPDTPDIGSPVASFPTGARTVAGTNSAKQLGGPNGDALPRPSSRKGFRQPASQRPRPSPLAPTPARVDEHQSALSSPQDPASTALSPHTADSNPGLVSDHEDDHGSASEDESPSSFAAVAPGLPRVPQTCGSGEEHMDIDIESDHEIDGRGGLIIRRNSMVADEARGLSRCNGSPSRKMGGK